MMRTIVTVAAVLALVGCGRQAMPSSSGPSAQDQETALEIVWEGVYSMKVADRPYISWHAPCMSDDIRSICNDYSTPGQMNLTWLGTKISDTGFSGALEADREWLVYPPGQLAPGEEAKQLENQAQDELRNSGL